MFQLTDLSYWLLHYSYFALFALLGLGIIGLPIPDEMLLAVTGLFIAKKKMLIIPALLAVFLGTVVGITVSYVLGRWLGFYFIDKYGYWLGLDKLKYVKMQLWFARFGKWILLIGYFMPGIRHFSGFIAGTMKLRYYQFALIAYSGALIWATVFVSLGYYYGDYWHAILSAINQNIYIAMIMLLLIILLYSYWKMRHH
jgi:membrane protein DedA with SNARE-associated domain